MDCKRLRSEKSKKTLTILLTKELSKKDLLWIYYLNIFFITYLQNCKYIIPCTLKI